MCHIYIIANMRGKRPISPVKIGISSTPKKRIAALQTANPNRLVLLATFGVPTRDMAKAIEGAFRHVKADKRMAGEWFDIEPMYAVDLMCSNIRGALNYLLEDEELRAYAVEFSCLRENEEKLAQWRTSAGRCLNDNRAATKCQ